MRKISILPTLTVFLLSHVCLAQYPLNPAFSDMKADSTPTGWICGINSNEASAFGRADPTDFVSPPYSGRMHYIHGWVEAMLYQQIPGTLVMGKELTDLEVSKSPHPNIALNFLLPVFIIVATNLTTFFVAGKASVLESFMLACSVLGIIMLLQRVDNLRGIMQTVLAGMKGVMPAVLILALAYCINTVSREMKTAEYVVAITKSWMAPGLLPVLLFLISGFISFATGTSWGTYAIMVPIALPLAYQFSCGTIDSLVLSSFAG